MLRMRPNLGSASNAPQPDSTRTPLAAIRASTDVEYDVRELIKEVDSGDRDSVPAYAKPSSRSLSLSNSPPSPEDDVPSKFDNLVFLSPEQYEALLKAREEQQHDLSCEQWEAALKALEEPL
ncbi:hypothetical protein ACLQ2S_24550 [Micromonospora sp. DT48]|uniref:hypothetical protein n=1 Tax=unclassified Micromonospora TaxID=2617518 RepID=UPI0012BB81B8|nr:hypothetical protein [Micromonospora sp. CP22]MTK05354.1 hypothetical protein [Micromonospora sp. CP22]